MFTGSPSILLPYEQQSSFVWHCIWFRPEWFVRFYCLCINVFVFVSALSRVSSWMLWSPFNVIQALKHLIILKYVQIKIIEQFKLPFSFCPSKGKGSYFSDFLFSHGESEEFYVSFKTKQDILCMSCYGYLTVCIKTEPRYHIYSLYLSHTYL